MKNGDVECRIIFMKNSWKVLPIEVWMKNEYVDTDE
jgi:hypothetical protein